MKSFGLFGNSGHCGLHYENPSLQFQSDLVRIQYSKQTRQNAKCFRPYTQLDQEERPLKY